MQKTLRALILFLILTLGTTAQAGWIQLANLMNYNCSLPYSTPPVLAANSTYLFATIFTVGQKSGWLKRSGDQGISWTHIYAPGPDYYALAANDVHLFVAASHGNIYRSGDIGANWTDFGQLPYISGQSNIGSALAIRGNYLFATTYSGKYYKRPLYELAGVTPTAAAAANITASSFDAGWNVQGGDLGYRLDVATDAAFTALVEGYNNKDVGNVTSFNVTGLTAATTYYYRVRALNIYGTSESSNIITTPTLAFMGTGTAIDPYQVATTAQLNSVRNYLGEANSVVCFQLTNDLDLTTYLSTGGAGYNGGAFWQPLGDGTNNYEGQFDGNGKVIKGLKINRPQSELAGLFGKTGNDAVIKNLGVEMAVGDTVKGVGYTGTIVGYNRGTISGCYAKGTVSGLNDYIGGISGYSFGSITNSYASVAVKGSNRVGGLVGACEGFTMENSYSTGSVSSTESDQGGLVGVNWGGTINNSYWDTETSGQTTSPGSDPSYGKTTAQMKDQATYVGWDFTTTTIWHLTTDNNGYPHLAWQIFEGPSALNTNLPPAKTGLHANYPNPFNPTTTIDYDLAKNGTVKLAVYNSIGAQVKTLVNATQNAGRYSVNFDGVWLNSGTYFYKLEVDGKSIVNKMLMVK